MILKKIELYFLLTGLITLTFFNFLTNSSYVVFQIFFTLSLLIFLIKQPKEYIKNFRALDIAFLSYIAILYASIFFNLDRWSELSSSLSKVRYYLIPVLIFPIIRFYQNKLIRNQKNLIMLLVLGATIASIGGLYNFYFNIPPFNVRVGGISGGIMAYAYGISLIITLSISYLLHFKFSKKETFILIAMTIINLIGLYFSYSRGALLGLIGAIPFLIYFKNKKLGLFIGSIFFIGFIALGYVLLNHINLGFYRFDGTFSDTARISQMKTSLIAFKDSIIIGNGYRGFNNFCPSIQEMYNLQPRFCGNHSHNLYIEFLSATGILGAITALITSIIIFINIVKSQTALFAPVFVNLMTSGLFQVHFFDSVIKNLFFTILFLVLLNQRTSSQN